MIKTILAHLNGAASDAAVLAASLSAARPEHAHIAALLVLPDPREFAAGALDIDSAMLLGDALAAMEVDSRNRSRDAQAAFARFCKQENVPRAEQPRPSETPTASFKDITGSAAGALAQEARFYDLVVVAGGPENNRQFSLGELGRVVLSCGRPVLLVPEQQIIRPFESVIVAWKDTPESARAVTAAMPILERAKSVEILSVSETSENAMIRADSCDAIARTLRWHGIDARPHPIVPMNRSLADTILQTGRERGADLIVMGAYGHSRLREFIFGGVTRHILMGVDQPVLLFH